MKIYDAYIARLTKIFRLGPSAAMPSDRCEALAHVIEQRFAKIEARLDGRDKAVTKQERKNLVESMITPHGGYTRETLEKLGVDWPPKQGWKERYINGENPNE